MFLINESWALWSWPLWAVPPGSVATRSWDCFHCYDWPCLSCTQRNVCHVCSAQHMEFCQSHFPVIPSGISALSYQAFWELLPGMLTFWGLKILRGSLMLWWLLSTYFLVFLLLCHWMVHPLHGCQSQSPPNPLCLTGAPDTHYFPIPLNPHKSSGRTHLPPVPPGTQKPGFPWSSGDLVASQTHTTYRNCVPTSSPSSWHPVHCCNFYLFQPEVAPKVYLHS